MHLERERCDAEEHRVEQEQHEQEEEEAQHRRSCQESTLTPVVALEMELPRRKGKGLELAPESEGAQESQRCDSCKGQDVECIQIKVSGCFLIYFFSKFTDNLVNRPVSLLPPLPGVEDLVLHQRWSSGSAEKGSGGGSWRRPFQEGPDGQGSRVGDGVESPTGTP